MCITRLLSALLALHLLAGCVSWQIVKEATVGEPPVFVVQVVFDDMPRPMIIVLSDNQIPPPPPVITALALTPPLTDCSSVNFYVNPNSHDSNLLEFKPRDIQPIWLKSKAEEMAQWRYIKQNKCTIILTIGYIEDVGFSGISASTSSGPFVRYKFTFPEGEPAKPSYWAALPFTLFGDAAITTGLIVYAPFIYGHGVPQDKLQISFTFPDNTRKETVVTRSECDDILKRTTGIYRHPAFNLFRISETCNEEAIDDWTRAALFKLRLSFEEEPSGDRRQLSSVGGHYGPWAHDVPCEILAHHRNVCTNHTLDGYFSRKETAIQWSLTSTEMERHNKSVAHYRLFGMSSAQLKQLATEGDPDAQLQLYWNDIYADDALMWLCRAADQGSAEAQYRLGMLYENGSDNFPKDEVRAYLWYQMTKSTDAYNNQQQAIRLWKGLSLDQAKRANRLIDEWKPGVCERDLAVQGPKY